MRNKEDKYEKERINMKDREDKYEEQRGKR